MEILDPTLPVAPLPSIPQGLTSSPPFNTNGLFYLKPHFLRVIRSLESVSKSQIAFTYKEVTRLLSEYILSKKDKFFDNSNVKICHVHGDDLGVAFGVRAFHRMQVT